MALRVNNNVAALNAYRNLTVSDGQQSKALEKLSSGFRINRAADDAAGLSISEGLRSQVGGLKVASRNAQDGVSVVQTAEGALTEVHSMLQRMRDLAVQASNTGANGGPTGEAVKAANAEVTQLKEAINQIATTTQFNGTKLLDNAGPLTFQVGANAGETLSVNLKDVQTAALGGTTKVSAINLESAATPAVAAVFTQTAAAGNIASGTAIAIGTASFTTTAAHDTSTSGGRTSFLADFAANGTLKDHYDASFDGSNKLVMTAKVAGDVTATTMTGVAGTETTVGAAAVDSGATTAIKSIDEAIKQVSSFRAGLGAAQNRLEHTISNLSVTAENLSASESRIRDADMAQEMLGFTRSQILSQAGTAMLAQANQSSQGVLSLLR